MSYSHVFTTQCHLRPVLRAVVLFLHALGTKTWLVQESFKQVFHGWIPRGIITVNIKPGLSDLQQQNKGSRLIPERLNLFL